MKHNKELTALAQSLRKNMTKEEKKLWYQFLKDYPVKFKRQVTCGEYILDFYCPKLKIAIELDGSYHQISTISENDKLREDYLDSVGIYVIRFPNCDIRQDFNQVCKQIDFAIQKRTIEIPRSDEA
ncbi:MAG: endonuclease domain-containing protein [Clostridia bacterium]|nr:endonuclease domain-containing protein [Clostridia bacterium]